MREVALKNSDKKEINWKEVFIIPAYNEQNVIENTVQNIMDKWYKNIIVINDWSTDNTESIIKNKFWNAVILLSHYINRWQWAALETWFEYVRRYWNVEYAITFDADWQHSINDLKKFYDAMDSNKKILVWLWSRFLWKAENIAIWRKITLIIWKIVTFIISWK